MLLIPLWDAMAFLIWLASFTRTSIRWRGVDYKLRNGQFVSNTEMSVPGAVTKGDS
jgi:ceramide glucosyltransferase